MREHGQPPLYYYVLSVIKSGHEPIFRWSSVFFSILGVLAIYRLGLVFFKSSVYGLSASWLLANSPLHIYYAQEIRMYSLLVLLAVLSVTCFWEYLHHSSGKKLIFLTLINLLMISTHTFGNLLVLLELTFLLLIRKKTIKFVEIGVFGFTILAFFWAYGRDINLYGGNITRQYNWEKLITPVESGTDLWTQVRLIRWLTGIESGKSALVFYGLFWAAGWLDRQTRRLTFWTAYSYILILIIAQFLLATRIVHYFSTRHFIFLEPILILVPLLATRVKAPSQRKWLILITWVYFAWVGGNFLLTHPVHYNNIP